MVTTRQNNKHAIYTITSQCWPRWVLPHATIPQYLELITTTGQTVKEMKMITRMLSCSLQHMPSLFGTQDKNQLCVKYMAHVGAESLQ